MTKNPTNIMQTYNFYKSTILLKNNGTAVRRTVHTQHAHHTAGRHLKAAT